MTSRHMFCLLALAALALPACESTITGELGNLRFSYDNDDKSDDFNKPIALGAKLDVTVSEAGDRDSESADIVIESVTSEDEAIFQVSKLDHNTLTIEAVGEGGAAIDVAAVVGSEGASETDRFRMRAATPDRLELEHLCTDDASARYLVGQQDAHLLFEMKLEDGQDVIGYGYYPVAATPAEGATVVTDSKDQIYVRLNLGQTPGEVTLKSTVDEESVMMTLVEAAQVDGATLEEIGSVRVGDTRPFNVLPLIENLPVCQTDLEFQISSTTPELCTAQLTAPSDGLSLLEKISKKKNWVDISGVAPGECIVEVTFPTGNDGAGASSQIAVTIEASDD